MASLRSPHHFSLLPGSRPTTQPMLGEGSTLLSTAHTSSGRGSCSAPGDPPEGPEARAAGVAETSPPHPLPLLFHHPCSCHSCAGSPSSALAVADPVVAIRTEIEICSKHRKSACAQHAAAKDCVSLCTFCSRSDGHALVGGSQQLAQLNILTNPRTW